MANHAVTRWARLAAKAHRKYHIPTKILLGEIDIESGGREGLTSSAAAKGLTQFIPGTARAYHVNTSPGHARSQIMGQAHYLSDLRKRYGSLNAALYHYSGGSSSYPGTVRARSAQYRRAAMRANRGLGPGGGGGGKGRTRTVRTKGVNNAKLRKQLIAQYLLKGTGIDTSPVTGSDPFGTQAAAAGAASTSNLLSLAQGLANAKDKPGSSRKVRVKGGRGARPQRGARGTANFEGHRVAAWIKPELVYARRHGWKGQVNSGFRSYADQVRIYNSGVRPAARPGTSNHEGANFPRGAVDVSDAAQLSRILRRRHSPLKWAGGKDPVHFSHPHGGSY